MSKPSAGRRSRWSGNRVELRIARDADPRNGHYRRFLLTDWTNLATIHRAQGDHAALASAAEELPRLAPEDPDQYTMAAWNLAEAADLASNDSKLSPSQQKERSRAYARRAVELLREAVRRGFDNAEILEAPDFDPLREFDRDAFEPLLRDMRANSSPATG